MRARIVLGSAALLLAGAAQVAPALAAGTSIQLRATRASVPAPRSIKLVGRVLGMRPGTPVELFKRAYPYRAGVPVRLARVAPDGTFSFTVFPDRNVIYQAAVLHGPRSHPAPITVGGRTLTIVRALPLGRVHVVVLVFHPRDLPWNRAGVHWSLGYRGRAAIQMTTRSTSLGPYITVLGTTAALPAGSFRWRVCFRAPLDHALSDPRRPPRCAGRGYQGSGRLPDGFPGPHAVARAAGYLRGRAGRTGFAVLDSEGRSSGVHLHWRFVTASVVKAMLLVEYLRRLDARGQRSVDAQSNSILYPMIHVSDNHAATQVYDTMGDGGLYALAARAHMVDFSVSGSWGDAQLSPFDQANFFFHLDPLLPPEFRGYAHWLLSTIADYESWGIPAVARALGYFVLFKGGWRGTSLGQLVHQVGRLSRRRTTFSLAVMTDGDPSMQYGIDTIQGVTAALLRP